ncbi:YJL050Wp-like protein [Desarmillaria tabescens]|uniref:YJL050Wp-like protein n=1 Tax=Armillaria tabescens TaxID=1929756 RepID=A0AA39K3F4_ARMTA|nr:YJL050Wp-like protein [Desarmillaria tabescens]KAK0452730.1 YJL050Wp-like protein [Desarmillaria tabescens]
MAKITILDEDLKIEAMEDKMLKNPLHSNPHLPELYVAYAKKVKVQEQVRSLKKQIWASQDVLQLDKLKCRKCVLRQLGFVTSDDIVDVKGCVACELSSGDELLLTELIFNGIFNALSLEQCAALLSCFIFDGESKEETKVKAELAAPLCVMQETTRHIARRTVASFKVELMDAVMQWCRGTSFQDIKKGSIIRVFHRLEELF